MKKTVQVNLSGQVFTIDDDAYDLLSAYLQKISRLYERSAGKDEILSDIESRIAELLLERVGDAKSVVTIKDVQEVTEIMGNPEQFEEETVEEEATGTSYSSRNYEGQKRLFRDPDSPMIGGVCSGIGYYFGIDPLWIRLAFAIALIFFGTGVLFYILLWVIIPEAKTTADKLAMRGEPVNIGSIGKSVEDELNNLGQRFSKGGQQFTSGAGSTIGRGVDKFFNFMAELFRGFFTVLGKVLGGLFILIGVFTLVVLLAGTVGVADIIHLSSHGWDSSWSIYEMGDIVFASSEWFFMAVMGFFLMIGIPFLALAYGGVVLLFPKARVPYLGASLAGLWFIGILLSIMTACGVAKDVSKNETITDVIPLQDMGLVADTLRLEVGEDPFGIPERRAYHANNDFMIRIQDRKIVVGNVSFDVRRSKTDYASLELMRTSQGASYEQATLRADSISYGFEADSSRLILNPYFSYPQIQLLRGQKLEVDLRIPVGQVIYLDNSMKRIIDNIDNVQNLYDPKMVNHYWIMTEDGLSCLDCEEEQPEEARLRIEGSSEDGNVEVDVRVSDGEVEAIVRENDN